MKNILSYELFEEFENDMSEASAYVLTKKDKQEVAGSGIRAAFLGLSAEAILTAAGLRNATTLANGAVVKQQKLISKGALKTAGIFAALNAAYVVAQKMFLKYHETEAEIRSKYKKTLNPREKEHYRQLLDKIDQKKKKAAEKAAIEKDKAKAKYDKLSSDDKNKLSAEINKKIEHIKTSD